jgi:hypothetical protein
MSDGPKLPLRVREVSEGFSVEDALGRSAGYVHFEHASGQPTVPPRFTEEAARVIAHAIARALREQLEDEEPGAGG